MSLIKPHVLMLLIIIMVISISHKSSLIEARTLSLISNQGYSKIFATLGVVCKCCDEIGGACTSTWTQSCNNLKCSPWKSH
ncbi:uncharacterized protein LOC123889817 [Trifolium pratense]|uniref:Uncharacterized protein n=1 Tax=Trifolium pratense TaxID=57577 RepID=A0ACB0LQ75_TRIPR|nr:uncharacterized protein LOC123889817 [Trifolium pratense]CAJ2670572.1 unnamed protein product [Trifolium pratense]